MENTAIASPQPPVAPVQPQAPPAAPMPSPEPVSYESGGIANKVVEFKLVEYLTFALLIAASVYSIYYHRQMLSRI